MTLESLVVVAEASAEHAAGPAILIPPAIAVVFFVVLGFITWSYRAAYNRHSSTGSSTLESNH